MHRLRPRDKVPRREIANSANPVILTGGAAAAGRGVDRVRATSMVENKREREQGLAEAPPHYFGHRERLRERFREAGTGALSDYELLRNFRCSAH
jgi:hypothetical protein